jgi:mRNA interferase RelE/StbE
VSRQVEWSKSAAKVFSRLDQTTQRRILAAMQLLAESEQGDVRRLQGTAEEVFRLRVGDWRVIFVYLEDGTIFIVRISARGDAYKR